jgi:hypothetical protein
VSERCLGENEAGASTGVPMDIGVKGLRQGHQEGAIGRGRIVQGEMMRQCIKSKKI